MRSGTPRVIGIRWTIGDVSRRGYEALRLSVYGARTAFGTAATLGICVNSLSVGEAQARVGVLPAGVAWVRSDHIPKFLNEHLEAGLAEGVAWKFAPLRLFPHRHELALDNDCILWARPQGVRNWLGDPHGCLLAEDVTPALGQFGPVVGDLARNTGIRGLPPAFDLEAALAEVLRAHPFRLISELDEQGLQVAALTPHGGHVVGLDDVAICSPFPPHAERAGRCGAHFVGLNIKRARPYCDGAAMERIAAFWDARWADIAAAVGAL
jgi:hypothetical protein